ncbi:ATP-dependent DNA helicase MER3 [Neodidymelliopsis sp. IMI 364377]|nr:ATP-dependent DNA helicase MER3 [Neodidymelliopsis sp. IMI 364377]
MSGSMRGATVTPQIASSMFSTSSQEPTQQPAAPHQPNMSKRRIENVRVQRRKSATSDDFGDIDIDDEVLAKVSCEDLDFKHIDNFADPTDVITRNNTARNKSSKGKARARAVEFNAESDGGSTPTQLPNGRWACSHKCKDKEACKHYCCKHGMDKPPKKAASKFGSANPQQDQAVSVSSTPKGVKVQSKLSLPASKRKVSSVTEELDLTEQEDKRRKEYTINGPRDYRDLHNLHKSVQKKDVPPSLYSVMHKRPAYSYGEGGQHQLSFLSQPTTARPLTSSEYGDLQLDEFEFDLPAAKTQPAYSDNTTSQHFSSKRPVTSYESDTFGDEDSLFGDAIVGLADSQDLQAASDTAITSLPTRNVRSSTAIVAQYEDTDFSMVDLDFPATREADPDQPKQRPMTTRTPVFQSTSNPENYRSGGRRMNVTPQGPVRQDKPPNQANPAESKSIVEDDEEEDDMSDLLNLLDMPVSTQVENTEGKQILAANEGTSKIVEPEQSEQEKVPDAFKGLQPWLFQEFGDIVELVNE